MSLESFGVVGFDLGPLLQGQTRIAKLKMPITCLLLNIISIWEKSRLCELCIFFSS